jgi:hypothetical protein
MLLDWEYFDYSSNCKRRDQLSAQRSTMCAEINYKYYIENLDTKTNNLP